MLVASSSILEYSKFDQSKATRAYLTHCQLVGVIVFKVDNNSLY